jgi:xylan 1,4-beta-xylosidase
MNLGHQLTLHQNGFNAVAAFPQYKQTPIVISEADPEGCGSCIEALPTYRTSPAYGAYEVVMMKRTLELAANIGVNVRGVLAWAFVVENAPLFAAYRVLASNGIDLPVLNAFKLLGGLTGDTLPVTSSGALPLASILANGAVAQPDIDAMASLNGQQVNVLVWNYDDVLETVAASPVNLTIQVPPSFGSQVTVSHLRVDDTHGDAYTVWVSQGSPPTPTAAQLTALQQAMVPSLLQPDEIVPVTAGAVEVAFDLPRFGLSLITVTAGEPLDSSANDASSGGAEAGVILTDSGTASLDATVAGATTPEASASDDSSNDSSSAPADAEASLRGAPGHSPGCGCDAAGSQGLPVQAFPALLALVALLCRRAGPKRRNGPRWRN